MFHTGRILVRNRIELPVQVHWRPRINSNAHQAGQPKHNCGQITDQIQESRHYNLVSDRLGFIDGRCHFNLRRVLEVLFHLALLGRTNHRCLIPLWEIGRQLNIQ